MKFTISHPVTPVKINQDFGNINSYYKNNGVNIDRHNGIDFQASHGQPVYATHDGMAFYETDDRQGQGVVIISDKPYDYKDGLAFFKTIYWHFCDPEKEPKYASPVYLALDKQANSGKGVPVKRGDLIGFADSTGLSTGDHLHFGLKPINKGRPPSEGDAPDVHIGRWVNVEQTNGYLGAIDPGPYFEGAAPLPPAQPSYTTETYENAFAALGKVLSGTILKMAQAVLRKKYNKV